MQIPKQGEIRKPSKTLAGVTPIAVMCKPRSCNHGTCTYCPSLNVPQSYLPTSPPVLRASNLKYDPFKQIKSRLKAFDLMNHPTEKIEVIIMGGTFLEYPKEYQTYFIKQIYNALNNKTAETLEDAKKNNERAKHRCVALCIETRPDTIDKDSIKMMLNWGATRVELGVQCLDDEIYKKINRGHKVQDVINATKLLKNAGFKIGYHMMLGLPGSNPKKDLETLKELFVNIDYKPDQLKIYPCQVIQGAQLEKQYRQGKYKPYTKEQIQNLIIEIMKIIPNYCRVMRIMREISPDYLVAGTTRIDLRKDIETELKETNTEIKEIRFREIGFHIRDLKPNKKVYTDLKLKTTKYSSSNGEEYFLEIVNKDNILFGLLRLRILNDVENPRAFIREVHVYGQSLKIGQKPKEENPITQHKGLGKKLIKEAEDIIDRYNSETSGKITELNIISGVGVREYYKKLDYKLDKNKIYMVKGF